ncbi:Fe-S cluster assembly protein SufD [Nocardioides dubius]|uniref:Fe-S cluster assembly protein SufD n=1 Tax=Nocardioides dubius TaxID=317019 RepID=A0ABN1U305_9ACTN
MTVTDNAAESVATALEVDKVESHLHPEGSFDVADHPVPTGREEIWRFTPLKRLRGLHDDAPLSGADLTIDVSLAEGVTGTAVPVADSARGISGAVPTDRVAARAWEAASSVYEVTIADEAVVAGASIITITGQGVGPAGAGHLLIRAGKFSNATVVVAYKGSAVWAENIELVLEDGAQLTFVTVQDWDDDAVHLVSQHARIGRDAQLKHVAVTFGGDVVRSDTSTEYSGPGGGVEALGLYFADEGQHIEHRLFVDHNAPRTTSNVVYKGALQGDGAHAVWIGNVLIRKVAEGIETYEENRNLILTDGTLCDSVPNLEIETGEIAGAGHASATARFDDNQLFYLRSRGIDEKEAQRLVVHGFFNDLIRKIDVPAIEEQLVATVEAELAKNVLKEI